VGRRPAPENAIVINTGDQIEVINILLTYCTI
jgi:hypothetical protein